MNFYDELEVSTSASTEVIKAAYKAQAKKYHPDIYRGDPRFSSEKLINLNTAYDILTNPQKREEYDYLNKINFKEKTTTNSYSYYKNTDTNTKNDETIFKSEDGTYSYKNILASYSIVAATVFLLIFILIVIFNILN